MCGWGKMVFELLCVRLVGHNLCAAGHGLGFAPANVRVHKYAGSANVETINVEVSRYTHSFDFSYLPHSAC